MRETILKVMFVISIFILGWFAGNLFLNLNTQIPLPIQHNGKEIASPSDWVKEEQIHVYSDRIIIDLKDAEWASFSDTNSMDPLIDETSNAIEIIPSSADDIHVGDIVSYKTEFADGIIIHRVVDIGEDELGKYFILRGDNNPVNDPEKVRFSQIQRVLVGIIY
ncbi:hypothetical protein DRJ17_03745 [Candidatus Woesearchaeota archaeon]|nr:MAG: hypothetical protein DRJ17_03745 [Candidatus Woesearchaeota archaeon]